mgnify:CR=1 FL=1
MKTDSNKTKATRIPDVEVRSGRLPDQHIGRKSKYDWSLVGRESKDAKGQTVYSYLVIRRRSTRQISSTVYAAGRRLGKRFAIRQRGGNVEIHLADQCAA